MRNRAGILCMAMGAVFLFGALSLLLWNGRQAVQAGQRSAELMVQLAEKWEAPSASAEFSIPADLEMTEVEINGHTYIGYLFIPSLQLELPILSDWDYEKLQIAPCRYSGTVLGQDLVLMAHNYWSHFGRISQLKEGDCIFFTDMNGIVTEYTVTAQDILDPKAVPEITAGNYDLTLFTCTYGGQNRVTVYCDRRKSN